MIKSAVLGSVEDMTRKEALGDRQVAAQLPVGDVSAVLAEVNARAAHGFEQIVPMLLTCACLLFDLKAKGYARAVCVCTCVCVCG